MHKNRKQSVDVLNKMKEVLSKNRSFDKRWHRLYHKYCIVIVHPGRNPGCPSETDEPTHHMRSITVPVVDDQTCMDTLPEFVYWGPFMVTDNCWVSMARTSGSCHSHSYVHSLDFCCTTYSNLSFVSCSIR